MISQVTKTDVTIFSTGRNEGAAELKRIAAVRGLDIVSDGKNGWLIGDNQGKITLDGDSESFWYTMVIFNDALTVDEEIAEVQEIPSNEIAFNPMNPMNLNTEDFAQIAELAKIFAGSGKIDGRKLSARVKVWGLRMGWLIKDKKGWRFSTHEDNKFFIPRYDLPTESVMLLLENDGVFQSGNSIGFSIVKKNFWVFLDIYPATSHHHNEKALREMEEVLMRLESAGLVTFYSAGRIWSLYKKEAG